MEEMDWMLLCSEQSQIETVLKMNKYSGRFGLTLTQEEARLLVSERRDSLKEQQRVEFGGGILPKLIFAFCDCPYVYQDNYVETLGRLQDIFYLYKNESMDQLSDDELLEFMRQKFDTECEGSLEYLEDMVLEGFAREIRSKTRAFFSNRYAGEFDE